MRKLLILLLAILPGLAFGQTNVLQGGSFTSGRAPMYIGQGSGQPVVGDSGPASGGGANTGLKELGVTVRGSGTAPYANAGTGQLGANICDYDGPTTGAYHYLCFSPNAQGGGLIAYGAAGGAATLPLQFIVNGQTYTIPPGGGATSNLATTNLPAVFMSYLSVGGWIVYKVDGTVLDTTNTTTQGLQEAINYAVTGGFPLIVTGQGYAQTAGTSPQLVTTTSVTIPPTLQMSMHFDNVVWLAAPANGGPGVIFDTAELMVWDFRALLLYRGNDYAVRFKPTNQNFPDHATAIDISSYFFQSVVVQNINGTTPAGNVYFDPSLGSILNNTFIFGEVCGSCGPSGTIGQNGIFVNATAPGTFFENNKISAQYIYGMSVAGVQVGPNATNQANLRFNDWQIGTIQPNGASSDGFNTFASYDTGNISVTNQNGSVNRAMVFETGTGGNYFYLRGGSGTLYSNSGLGTNIMISNGIVYGSPAGSKTYQAPSTGFSITVPDYIRTIILAPSGTLATGEIIMPANPGDGQEVHIVSSAIITALTFTPNSGQTINAAPTVLTPSTTTSYGYAFIYDLAHTKWFRLQ